MALRGNPKGYSAVLLRAAHSRELPGIRYSIIRGKTGFNPVLERRKHCSKYNLKPGLVKALLWRKNWPLAEEEKASTPCESSLPIIMRQVLFR